MTLRSIRRTTVLLAGLCLALMGGVLLEWFNPPQLSTASIEVTQRDQPIPREPSPGNVSLPPLSKYEEIVSRPLFLADRRPPPEAPEPSTEPVAEQETTMWLVGVMLSPEGQRALVHLKEDNRLVRLQVGESAGGWKLESLNSDSATLRRNQDTLELKLERNRKDGPPPPQAAPQRTARQAATAAQPPQQTSAQKGARAPAAAPQQPQQAGRQAPTPPAAPGRPGPAGGARQPAPQAPTAGRPTAAPPARPAAPPVATQPAAPSPRLQRQLDAITPDEDSTYVPDVVRQSQSRQ